MSKKNYFIIGITLFVAVIVVVVILLTGNKKDNWLKEISNSDKYSITMKDCNGREVSFSNNIIDKLSENWQDLTNNGPWTGDNSLCYSTINISFEKGGIVNNYEILLIDDNSLVLNNNETNTYYINSKEINKTFNNQFSNTKTDK